MRLYLHVSRDKFFNPGDTIINYTYPPGHTVNMLETMLEKDFVDHINKMYKEGISNHGYQYLVKSINGGYFTNWALEIYFEYVRFREFPDLPSRFQSVFAWAELADALAFSNIHPIYEIKKEEKGKVLIADMNLLKTDFNSKRQKEKAMKYWNGEPADSSTDYRPCWEYVINTPFKIIQQVKW